MKYTLDEATYALTTMTELAKERRETIEAMEEEREALTERVGDLQQALTGERKENDRLRIEQVEERRSVALAHDDLTSALSVVTDDASRMKRELVSAYAVRDSIQAAFDAAETMLEETADRLHEARQTARKAGFAGFSVGTIRVNS